MNDKKYFRDNYRMNGIARGIFLVKCPICGEAVFVITSIHLAKHNLTLTEFISLDESFIGLTGVQDTKESTAFNKRRNNRLRNARNYHNKNKEAIALKRKEKRANNRDKTLGIRKNRIGGGSNA